MKVKTDSATNSLLVIYSKGLKLYQKQTPLQTPSLLYKDLKIYEN